MSLSVCLHLVSSPFFFLSFLLFLLLILLLQFHFMTRADGHSEYTDGRDKTTSFVEKDHEERKKNIKIDR